MIRDTILTNLVNTQTRLYQEDASEDKLIAIAERIKARQEELRKMNKGSD